MRIMLRCFSILVESRDICTVEAVTAYGGSFTAMPCENVEC